MTIFLSSAVKGDVIKITEGKKKYKKNNDPPDVRYGFYPADFGHFTKQEHIAKEITGEGAKTEWCCRKSRGRMVISEHLIIIVIFSQSGKATASEYSFLRMSIKVFRLSR